jgi:hypothetical protein
MSERPYEFTQTPGGMVARVRLGGSFGLVVPAHQPGAPHSRSKYVMRSD